jgi:hypothetical protein
MSGAIDLDSLPVIVEGPGVEIRGTEAGELSVALVRLRQGHDARPLFKGLPDDLCQCPHWGYVLKGRQSWRFADHEEVYEAGDAFYQPPGHRPYVDAGTELLQFSPTEELAATEQAVAEWMNAQQGAS